MSGEETNGNLAVASLLHDTARQLAAAGILADDARAETRLLLAHALNTSRTQLLLRERVSAEEAARFAPLIARRAARVPLAYILGEREFYGLPFFVSPHVLIPRPETELLVETALQHLRAADRESAHVTDVGTGSGCIAVSVAVHFPDARLWATDISEAALLVAEKNARRHQVAGRITFLCGDLLSPLPADLRFAVIASNPPYVRPEEIPLLAPEVRDHEPNGALRGGPDGLEFYRRLAADAPPRLCSGGLLIVEVGAGQAEEVADLWRGANLKNVAVLRDLAGIERVVCGSRR